MSQYNVGFDITFSVSEDLSASQYLMLKIGASNGAALLNGTAGGPIVGVLQEKLDGSSVVKHARVRISGVTKVVCGGTCTRGSFGTSDSAGKAVNETGSNKHRPLLFLESGVTGDIISAIMTLGGKTDA